MRDRVFAFFVLGLLVRLLLAPYTQHAAVWERIMNSEYLLIYGINPLAHNPGFGVSFLVFYLPMHITYFLLSSFGIGYNFILTFLYKIPPIIGDVLVFYSLYNISLHFSKESAKSANIAATYFLNPFVIWQGAAMGHTESLTVGFMLLALAYLLDDKVRKSAVSLCVATFFRYLPALVAPLFIVYLWRRDNSFSPGVSRFLKAALFSTAILSIGYFMIVLQLYALGPSALLTAVGVWWSNFTTGGTSAQPGGLPGGYYRNFTSFLAELGLWPMVSALFSTRTFLVIYLVVILFAFRRKPFPARLISQLVAITFSLFLIFSTLYESHYLMWVFPFLLLEALLFSSIPTYYPHILWFSSLLIDAITGGQIVEGYYWVLPSFPKWDWSFPSNYLNLSLSLLHGLVLVAIIIRSSSSFIAARGRSAETDTITADRVRERFSRTRIVVKLGRRRAFLLLGFLTIFIVSSFPLVQAAVSGELSIHVPNIYYFGSLGKYTSSYGSVNLVGGGLVLGNSENCERSGACWESDLWIYPFLSQEDKNASRAFLVISALRIESALSPIEEETSQIRITVGDHEISNKSVSSLKEGQVGQGPWIYWIPVDFRWIGLTNSVEITIGPHVSWNINSVAIQIEVSNEIVPFWSRFQSYVPLIFGLELIALAIALRKLHEWFSSGLA